jgi:hypothetical protein
VISARHRRDLGLLHSLGIVDSESGEKAGASIFFGDEAGVRSDYHSGTTWAPIGQTPVVRTTGKRFGCNMISAVSAKGELRFMITRGCVNADVFITFLRRLLYGAKGPVHRRRAPHTPGQTDARLRGVYGR